MRNAVPRGRFAPTPSGYLHIGNMLAALLSWLQMRKLGGQFVLRIEDNDLQRSKPEYAKQLLADLRWLGIDWDEGPDVGGPYAPYVQSKRLHFYEEAMRKLKEEGLVYPCYCSRADLLRMASAPHGLSSEGPAYPGLCRHLTEEERRTKAKDKEPSWRFAMPVHPISFCDAVQGEQQFAAGAGGDFVVVRADRMFGYQLAVVVDDAAMRITDVLRGADLLDSVPRQLQLYEALELTAPRFAHFPLLCGPDGRRLSKRHGSIAASCLRKAGCPPERLTGQLAYWAGLIDRAEPLSAAELIPLFQVDKLSKAPVTVYPKELEKLSQR